MDKIKGIDIDNNHNITLIRGDNKISKFERIDCDYVSVNTDEIIIKKNNKWGIIIIDDDLFIKPNKYDYISKFFNNIACVKLNDKFGLINKKGEEITPIIFDNVDKLDDNKIRRLFLNGLTVIVDDNGNIEMERNKKIKNIINRINDKQIRTDRILYING